MSSSSVNDSAENKSPKRLLVEYEKISLEKRPKNVSSAVENLSMAGQVPEVLDGKAKLRKWLNMNFRIEMTDGRVLIGVFLCTDRDANIILGACSEYLKSSDGETEEPRVLGLVMVPGRHIVSIQIDDTSPPQGMSKYYYEE